MQRVGRHRLLQEHATHGMKGNHTQRAQHTCIVDVFFHRTFISSVKEHRRCSVRFPELVVDTHALLVGATVATREM